MSIRWRPWWLSIALARGRLLMAADRQGEATVLERLSTLDRYLPWWIAVAMGAGLALGSLIPGLNDVLDALRIGTVSVPIAVGLLLMMYPVLAKVRYEEMGRLTGQKPLIGASLALNWLFGPLLMLFAIQGDAITSQPLDVVRIAVPLLAYFLVMLFASFALGRAMGLGYARTATLALTAASNNFELAIAVAVGVFGATSGQALAGVVGPLIEVPVLVGLVYVALWLGRRWFGAAEASDRPATAVRPTESPRPV